MKVANGYPDNTFQPQKEVTRAEFAKLIVQALNLPLLESTLSYADASVIPAWAKGYIAAAEEKGIIQGYEDKSFRPNQLISRTEMAAMIVRAMGGQTASSGGNLEFIDAAEIPSWAEDYVALAVQEMIINGKPGNKFAPQDKATRAESAVMIYRLLNSLNI
ncbi:S-layer homology domain-containing protein [Dehalobacterium formicoaceticum]|uniref:S-layer homology domain-containing protein n=1 Tax=Dehalobacterium formicoaceticum TaxID=51515 RepID=UPI000B802A58|nr:S-layer homology domain-containing protein [Dehalobacterium formicoaceticum]